jgi:GTP-binding protein
MKFVDSTEIHVRAGDGGPGMVCFKSARNMPRLGADGGDGGYGGNVVLVGNSQINTLSSLRYKRAYHAENGARGGANNRTGATGNDLRIDVPLGTIVHHMDTGVGLGEIVRHGDEIVIAKGGKRGLGNQRFLSSTHQAPEEYTPGGKGEARRIGLELKLLADVGFAGLPNAGKSTLLSRISAARPKIADYPFTTLVPHLGVVELSDSNEFGSESFVAADVPGLIEGASDGKGLGHAFLRHLERTRVIAYVVDALSSDETATPVAAFKMLRAEMERYSPELAAKRALVILNKIDLLQEDEQKAKLEAQIEALTDLGCETIQISAVAGTGLRELKRRIYTLVKEGGDVAAEVPAARSTDAESMLPFKFVPSILTHSTGRTGASDSSDLRRDI